MRNKKSGMAFILITILIDIIGIGIIIPVLPDLIKEFVGGSMSDAALYGMGLLVAYSVMVFLFAPIIGGLSDQYGRRPVILASLFGFAIDYFFLALAPTIWLFFVGRLLAGITGSSLTPATAYIADISPPEKKAQNFGLIGAAFGVGFVIGPALGGILGEFGTRIPFFVSGALAILNFLYGYFVLPESLPTENRRKFEISRANPIGNLLQFKKFPKMLDLVFTMALLYIAAHAVQSTWSFFTRERFDWSSSDVGWSLAFVGILVAFVQGFLIRVIVPKIGEQKAVYAGLTFNALGMVFFSFAWEGWMIYVFLVPYALGGLAGPSIQSIMSNQVQPSEQGELQGALTSLAAMGAIIGPLVMNSIFSYFSDQANAAPYFPGAPMVLGAILSIWSILYVIRSFNRVSAKATDLVEP